MGHVKSLMREINTLVDKKEETIVLTGCRRLGRSWVDSMLRKKPTGHKGQGLNG